MTPGTSFSPLKEFSLLLVGPPLSGKTTIAAQFPDPYIISTDHKLQNAVSRMPPGKKWWFDYVDVDEKGILVPEDKRWERLVTLAQIAGANPEVKTIITDNLSDTAMYLIAHIIAHGGTKLTVGGEKSMEQQHWQPFKTLMSRYISKLRTFGKAVVVCAHETGDKDEKTGALTYKPLIEGQMRDRIAGFFTDVWRTQAERVPKSPKWPEGVRYFIRTMPTSDMMLGNSLNLPADYEFTFEDFMARLSGSKIEQDSAK